ncbi:MAG: hypothetical protein ACTSVF_03175 [Candidatus Asgardarchaeia archaeon]
MIYSVWVIGEEGLPILSRNYSKYKIDSALFSGFVTALYNFSLELSEERLKEITMGNTKIVLYNLKKGGLLVITISADDKPSRYITFFERIENEVLPLLKVKRPLMEADGMVIKMIDQLVEDYNRRLIPKDVSKVPLLKDPKVQTLLTYLLFARKDKELTPVWDKTSRFGYTYKEASNLLMIDTDRLFLILNYLTDFGILIRNEYESVAVCPVCGSMDIHIAYRCPKCHSMRVSPIRLIRHNNCGYVGPADLFVTIRGLKCPQCGEILKKKGMDYEVENGFYCRNCNNLSTDFEEVYHCFQCNYKSRKDELDILTIYSYSLNPDVSEDVEKIITTMGIKEGTPIQMEESVESLSVSENKEELGKILEELKSLDQKWAKGEISTAERDRKYIELKARLRDLMKESEEG